MSSGLTTPDGDENATDSGRTQAGEPLAFIYSAGNVARFVDRLNRIASDRVTMHIDDIKDPVTVLSNHIKDMNLEIRGALAWFVSGRARDVEEFIEAYKDQ